MDETSAWTMDEVAATALLTALGLEQTTEHIDLIKSHLARHRYHACIWAAGRTHGAMIDRLERASADQFSHHGGEWTDGFRGAEQIVMTMRPDALLGMETPPARSKGQLLRAMVRDAKRNEPTMVVKMPA